MRSVQLTPLPAKDIIRHAIISPMIADIAITEKSFGAKTLMTDVKFSVNDGEKVGLVGRNGVGKSTLFGMLTGVDDDYSGSIIFKRGSVVVATAQEHHDSGDITVLEYILRGLPEYARLRHIIRTYPETMGDDMHKIEAYTAALERFGQKGFYQIEELVAEELKNFQMAGYGERHLASLSGGQKRLVEVVKIMHAQADLALIDEPTNHMDYVAKKQFVDWLKDAKQAMLVITHDRDVLAEMDRIVEIKDGTALSYRGDYDAYLRQNASATGNAMHEYEQVERRIANVKDKVVQFRRMKERARDPGTIKQFKQREQQAMAELEELEQIEKPTFWIDRDNVAQLEYKMADRYQKFKARTIRLSMRDGAMRSQRTLVAVRDLALGYGERILFEGVNIDLREGEAVELRGRNGAGKTTLIRELLAAQNLVQDRGSDTPIVYSGSLQLDSHIRIGVYEQEIAPTYLGLTLAQAIEQMHLDRGLPIGQTKLRQLMSDYLFAETDGDVPLARLSGGQKARFQIISMLANEPQLLILDEPTNHLDLPSIEELEAALERYTGAILYVSHDNYFRQKLGGEVVQIGAQ